IAARSYYRMYMDGVIIANGPARTAKQYCRVDQIKQRLLGHHVIAIEVIALDKPDRYCNDCTLEPGMLTAEISLSDGTVLTSTGDENWRYVELNSRRSEVETMSHSRGIIEWYDLDPHSFDWRMGEKRAVEMEWRSPVCTEEAVTYLERRAPYVTYRKIPMKSLLDVTDIIPVKGENDGFILTIAKLFNPVWYQSLPEENKCLLALRNQEDTLFTGTLEMLQIPDGEHTDGKLRLTPGENPSAVLFTLDENELGFLALDISVEAESVIDILNCDHLQVNGELKGNTYVTRYHLMPGSYHLVTFEPKMVRYVKIICNTIGKTEITYPYLLDDSYPDDQVCTFQCDDGDLNRIYEGSRRTLRLTVSDIFMDCPQRERGGWLCDSQFTSCGAWQMFGNLAVEKDFLENFLLTDPDQYWHSFFPGVYPGCDERTNVEMDYPNWSFWFAAELYLYYQRSGDREFIEAYKERVFRFVEGMLSLRGESGLLENMPGLFVDWSLANRDFAIGPISIPNNCLVVRVLEMMAELYQVPVWKVVADEMRQIIEKLDGTQGIFGGGGDGAEYRDGVLRRTDCPTEGGMALELWAGFHWEDRGYLERFVQTMGPCPARRSNPNIGKANMFIGMMIRFEVLARLGKINTLVHEMKNVYLEELKLGSGTFFENINAAAGCHGFNGDAGALITQQVLGLGEPQEKTKTIVIAPHPGTLTWAKGTARCKDGMFFLKWMADHEKHILYLTLQLPKGWKADYRFPFELQGWEIRQNQ
ncbi:MAG: hypothetical protein IJW67_06385, partial [Blautia sp.]|nr:hypothetical protein [Blautia sp.]